MVLCSTRTEDRRHGGGSEGEGAPFFIECEIGIYRHNFLPRTLKRFVPPWVTMSFQTSATQPAPEVVDLCTPPGSPERARASQPSYNTPSSVGPVFAAAQTQNWQYSDFANSLAGTPTQPFTPVGEWSPIPPPVLRRSSHACAHLTAEDLQWLDNGAVATPELMDKVMGSMERVYCAEVYLLKTGKVHMQKRLKHWASYARRREGRVELKTLFLELQVKFISLLAEIEV